jgi:hypothetical protein
MTEDVFQQDQKADDKGTDTSSSQETSTEDLLATITREDGSQKYGSVDEALKGAKEAQEFVTKLQEENKTFREELDKRMSAEAVLEQIKASKQTDEKPSADFDANALKELVQKEVVQISEQATATANVNTVSDALKQHYGDKANEAVATKAKEVGMSMDTMKQLSAESPAAVLSLFGLASQETSSDSRKPSGSVNTESVASTGVRNYAYYAKMRKDDPNAYRSQYMRMMKDAAEQGEAFYN